MPFNTISASHLVGSDISYAFVERKNDKIKYRFTLKIYRDIFETQNAFLDPSIRIWVFHQNSTGYSFYGNDGDGETINVPLSSRTTVPNPKYPCLTPPLSIGVEVGVYTWEVTFKDSDFKYVLTHFRCCRNETINNIYTPDRVGNAFTIDLLPEAQHVDNNSPTFSAYPPILICAGVPLQFDYSATDKEGDVLKYSFCTPLVGASRDAAIPVLPVEPPYSTVTFKTPFYTFDSPLGKNSPIQVDSKTGIITGVPNQLGQFVMSICAEEYRNGKLLSKVIRDFQFNVVLCKQNVTARIEADSASGKTFFTHTCDLTTTLKNLSFDSTKIESFSWVFNIDNQIKTIQDWNPKLSFKDSGQYVGKLYINPNTPCKDSAEIKIKVSNGIKSFFTT